MNSKFDFHEFSEYVQKLGIAKSEFRIWLKTFLLKEAQRVVRLAKQKQAAVKAVDTGAMINSWYIGSQNISLKQTSGTSKSGKSKVTFDKNNSDILSIKLVGNVLEVEIGNSMDYASYIEFGHRSYEGKYLLTTSIDKVQRALPARFDKDFKNWLKSKGVM